MGVRLSSEKFILTNLPNYKGGTVRAGDYNFFYGKGKENHQLGTRFFVHQRRASAVKRVEFVSDRMSYIVLRGRWCKIIGTYGRRERCAQVFGGET